MNIRTPEKLHPLQGEIITILPEKFNPDVLPGLPRFYSIQEIINILLKEMKIADISEITIKTRKREIVSKRQTIQHLLYWYGHSPSEIGNYFMMDHASVDHSYKTVEKDMFTNKELKEFVWKMKHTKLAK